MPRYHITSAGKTDVCKASVRPCPLGGQHYDNLDDANTAASLKADVLKAWSGSTSSKGDIEKSSFVDEERYRNIKKMPAVFVIDRVAHKATMEVNENAAWIFSEPSRPTLKRDGTSVTVAEDGTVYARRSVRKGKKAPAGFIHAETDSFTGHQFGLEPVSQSGFAKVFNEASEGQTLEPGTYELCGPSINGNPENLTAPKLMPHGGDDATEIPDMRTVSKEEAYATLNRIFDGYKEQGIEGVVWWGADGKRAKLRVKDFYGDPNRR